MAESEHALQWLVPASEDLESILAHLAKERPSAAEALAIRIEDVCALLMQSPFLGKILPDRLGFSPAYRILIVEAYVLVYLVEDEVVLIHRLLHGARNYREFL